MKPSKLATCHMQLAVNETHLSCRLWVTRHFLFLLLLLHHHIITTTSFLSVLHEGGSKLIIYIFESIYVSMYSLQRHFDISDSIWLLPKVNNASVKIIKITHKYAYSYDYRTYSNVHKEGSELPCTVTVWLSECGTYLLYKCCMLQCL